MTQHNFAFALALMFLLQAPSTDAAEVGPWRDYSVYQPDITLAYGYDGSAGRLKYNHCAAVVWYGDRWLLLWNANTVPYEGKPNQPIVLSTSRDFTTWSKPVEPFSDARYSTNPVPFTDSVQWQPGLVVYRGELWCFWNQIRGKHTGTYFSRLSDPDGKWTNRKLDFGSHWTIEAIRYNRFFPGQNAIALRSGRVLAPGNAIGPRMTVNKDLQDWRKRHKRDSVLITDDGGETWRLSPGATLPGREWAVWEPTVWQCDDGAVRMVARSNDWDKGTPATEMLLKSVSRDGGMTWTPHEYVPIETISSRMHVLPLAGDRFVMVHNDWRKGKFAADRQNLALFFNRGGGFDFVAGVGISGRDTRVAYPQMFVKDDALHVAYTMQGSPSSIRVSRISPLPAPDRYYLFPRANTPPPPRPALREKALCFNSWQHLETRWVNRVGKGNLSVGMWVKARRTGALMDTRGPGRQGLLFHLGPNEKGLTPIAFLSTKEWNIKSKLVMPTGEWCYVGLSIDNVAGKVHFFLDGRTDTKTFVPPAPLSSRTGYFGHKRFPQSSIAGLVGRIRWAAVFEGRCLTAEQHWTLFNAYAGEFGRTQLPGAQAPPEADVVLDSSRDDWKDDFVIPSARAMRVETTERGGRQLVRFRGEASAGVDLDRNRPAKGDVVEIEFAFRIETPTSPKDEVVLCTTGSGNTPLRVVVNGRAPNTVQVRLAGKYIPVGPVRDGGFTTVRVKIAKSSCAVRVANEAMVEIPFPTTGTWLYLGQGYLENRVRDSQSFVIDLTSVRTRVVRSLTH